MQAKKEMKKNKKEKLTGSLVSILKRTYENLMRMMFVSRSTSCMILIRRLDKLLGPNSMNLERNWSHCINWKLVNVKRKKAKDVLCCVFDTISTRFNNIDFTWRLEVSRLA